MTRAESLGGVRRIRAVAPVVIHVELEATSLGSQIAPHWVDLPVGKPSPVSGCTSVVLLRGPPRDRPLRRRRPADGDVGFPPATFHAVGARFAAESSPRLPARRHQRARPASPLFACGAPMLDTYPSPRCCPGTRSRSGDLLRRRRLLRHHRRPRPAARRGPARPLRNRGARRAVDATGAPAAGRLAAPHPLEAATSLMIDHDRVYVATTRDGLARLHPPAPARRRRALRGAGRRRGERVRRADDRGSRRGRAARTRRATGGLVAEPTMPTTRSRSPTSSPFTPTPPTGPPTPTPTTTCRGSRPRRSPTPRAPSPPARRAPGGPPPATRPAPTRGAHARRTPPAHLRRPRGRLHDHRGNHVGPIVGLDYDRSATRPRTSSRASSSRSHSRRRSRPP